MNNEIAERKPTCRIAIAWKLCIEVRNMSNYR